MTDRTRLFRREALEFQAGVRGHDAPLRVDEPWTRWLYWLVLALALAGPAVAGSVEVEETTSGAALIDPVAGTFVALVPGAGASELQRGHRVRLEAGGGTVLTAWAQSISVTDEAGARRAGFAPPSVPAALVTGVLAVDADTSRMPAAPRHEGRAVMVLRSDDLLHLFFDGVGGLLGTGGDR